MAKHRMPRTKQTTRRYLIAVVGGIGLIGIAPGAASADQWDEVAACESNNDWDTNTGNGYYGGLQFSSSTWRAYGGTNYADRADEATISQQKAVAEKVLEGQGKGAWPVCGKSLEVGDYDAGFGVTTKVEEPKSSSGSDYIVVSGDTLSKIAKRNGVTVTQLLKANPGIDDPDLIYRDQHLTLTGT